MRQPLTVWRLAAWTLGLWPAAELVWRFAQAQLTANPVEFLEHHTGLWALRLLLVALAMTPLHRLTARGEFVQLRRLLGLWAYAWVCVHFAIFLSLSIGRINTLFLMVNVQRVGTGEASARPPP